MDGNRMTMDDGTAVSVAVVQRVVPGFRVPVFEALGASDRIDLTVFHGTNPRDMARGNAETLGSEQFESVALSTSTLQLFGLHFVWFSRLLSRIRSGDFDVVVCPASPSLLQVLVLLAFARLRGVGFVWWGKSLGSKKEVGLPGKILRRLAEVVRGPLYRWADACVCYSTAAAAYFESYGVSDQCTFVAYNSTDTTWMRELESRYRGDDEGLAFLRQEYNAGSREVLFFVGTLTAEKNVENLVEAHRRLQNRGRETTLVVAGSGPLADELQYHASEVPHLRFTGRISDEELAKHLLVADLFVMPGHGGLAVQQAMTFGLPVVTVPLDGTEQDLIETGQNGYVVPSDDVEALAEAVETVLELDDEERRRMGRRSRAIVDETVNIDRMIDGFRGAIAAAAHNGRLLESTQ